VLNREVIDAFGEMNIAFDDVFIRYAKGKIIIKREECVMKKNLIYLVVLMITMLGSVVYAADSKHDLVDAHLHFVDFAQNTDGVDALISCMDNAGVTDAVMFGLPVTKIWGEYEKKQPVHSLDAETRMYWDSKTDYIVAGAYLKATPEQQKKLHPFLCGINTVDKNSLQQVKRLIQIYPGTWQGIGEVFAHHDYISYMTAGEIPRPDSAALMEVYKFAGEYGMPVIIHTNITSGSNTTPLYMDQLMNAVKANPKTKFVWAHIGISNDLDVNGLAGIIMDQLKMYPNLSVDLSWLVFDNIIAPKGVLNKAWIPVIKTYPDRFTIGTDIVGRFLPQDKYYATIHKYDVLLDALPADIAQKVAHDNFLNLLPPTGIVLKDKDRIQM